MCTWHDREDTQTCRGSGRGSGSWCASRPCRTACTCEGCSRLAPGQRSAACARLLNLQHQHKTSHFQLLASQHDLYDDEPPAAHSLCRRRLDRFSLSLSLFLSSHLYSLSLVLSVSVSPSSPFAPPPYLLLLILRLLRLSPFFSPHSSPLPLFYLFFFFFFITSPLIFPSVYPPTYESRPWSCHAYIYMSIHVLSSLSSPLSEEKFSSTPRFLKPPHFSSTPEKRGRSRVTLLLSVVQRFGARERGSRDGDGSIDVSSRDHARVFFFSFWDSKKGDVYLAYRRKKKRYEFFFFFPR